LGGNNKGSENASYSGPFLFELSQKNALSLLTPKAISECWAGLLNKYLSEKDTLKE
jgi:hypothetical protein